MNQVKTLVAALLIAVMIGCATAAANPMVGTWKLQLEKEAMDKMPAGTKVPDVSVTFKDDGTYTASAKGLGGADSTVEGKYKLEGKTLTMTTEKEDGKAASKPAETVTLADDMKSFPIPGSNGMGKMVKQ